MVPSNCKGNAIKPSIERKSTAMQQMNAPVLHQLIQVLLHVLKDEVEYVVLPDDLLELDDIGVAKLLQGLNLAQIHRLLPRVVLALHAFDGDLLARVDALAEHDRAEGAIAQLVQRYVAIHRHLGRPLPAPLGP